MEKEDHEANDPNDNWDEMSEKSYDDETQPDPNENQDERIIAAKDFDTNKNGIQQGSNMVTNDKKQTGNKSYKRDKYQLLSDCAQMIHQRYTLIYQTP